MLIDGIYKRALELLSLDTILDKEAREDKREMMFKKSRGIKY